MIWDDIAEIRLWKDAGIDIAKHKSSWCKENGHAIGAALNTVPALPSRSSAAPRSKRRQAAINWRMR
jgi:hypothetical protein